MEELRNLVVRHAPDDWEATVDVGQLYKAIDAGVAIQMVVLAADIRSSTLLMKEAIDFQAFAKAITDYVDFFHSIICHNTNGWFDKFTGDGFLAYWIVDKHSAAECLKHAVDAAFEVCDVFRNATEQELRANSRNVPARMGISVGIDAGLASLVRIAGELTVVGSPVVGAVRMVSKASPYEIIANSYAGMKLLDDPAMLERIEVEPTVVTSKEYPDGQWAYRIRSRQ